jgi:hypothetical protein
MLFRPISKVFGVVLAAATLPSCIFANVTVPLAYRSPTPSDVGGVSHLGQITEGHACSHLVLGLIAWGDGGYARAMDDAAAHAAPVVPPASAAGDAAAPAVMAPALLADVQADTSALNVLGLYQRRCTVIHAKVVQ